ncbi:phosphoglycerate mutase family protein [Changchengzhania lutea]|uniref:phosphoglycerate mutase family protein n=1 Tax=Changchengzhania lutea TaxID=2049305 RepID=UPI00115F76D5|nr:phosphoglycerate mutase family protein [Changchengzhania lutea]
MKLITLLYLLIFTACADSKKNPESTDNDTLTSTYYFIRHAEKDRSNPSNDNPNLLEIGEQRAERWSKTFEGIDFDAVYATNFNRTQATGMPTAKKNNLQLTIYDPNNIDVEKFLEDTKGKTILVVGHSDSTPKFVNTILGEQKHEAIDDDNNANLYKVTINGDTKTSELTVVN